MDPFPAEARRKDAPSSPRAAARRCALPGQAAGEAVQTKAPDCLQRANGGWEGSTINGYIKHGDEATYKHNFRATKSNYK